MSTAFKSRAISILKLIELPLATALSQRSSSKTTSLGRGFESHQSDSAVHFLFTKLRKKQIVLFTPVTHTFASEPFDKLSQRFPLCSIHVSMFLVLDVFIVDDVTVNASCAKPSSEQLHKTVKELPESGRTTK